MRVCLLFAIGFQRIRRGSSTIAPFILFLRFFFSIVTIVRDLPSRLLTLDREREYLSTFVDLLMKPKVA